MKKGLQLQMTLWVLAAVVIISSAILWFVASTVRRDFEAEIRDALEDDIETTVSNISTRLSRVEYATKTIGKIMTDFTESPEVVDSILCRTLVGMECIDAISIVTFEELPDGEKKFRDRCAHYDERKNVLLDDIYNTVESDSYPILNNMIGIDSCAWSNPFRVQNFSDNKALGYCVSIINQRGEKVGIVFSSLLEKWLGNIVSRYKASRDIDVAIITASGDTIVDHDDYIKQLEPEYLITKSTDVERFGWTFVFSIDRHVVSDRVNEVLLNIGVLMLVLLVSLCIAVTLVVKYVAQPFMKKQNETETKNAIMEHEMDSAAKTQRELVPHTFPPFPERGDIDIYACLHPARNVGGDLYDYFINNDELYFCIGDVSGKGTQASLFMSATHYLFRSVASSLPTSEAMQRINLSLCTDNDSCMFVTFFFGRLNLKTGEMEYCNAGHNSPIMVSGGEARFFPTAENMPLGVWDEAEFEVCHTEMHDKDLLLLYTDGVTEAANAKGELLGDAETLKTSASCDTPEAIINALLQRIHTHADGAEQSDDITMVGVKFVKQ